MSFRQRALPFMGISLIGIASGYYIFDPLLRQYAIDSRGTFDPSIAKVSESGGAGGGVVQDAKGQAERDPDASEKARKAIVQRREEVKEEAKRVAEEKKAEKGK